MTDRALVCTKDNTRWQDNCDTCTTWRLVVWRAGGSEYHEGEHVEQHPSRISTLPGKYYAAHEPCRLGDNYPSCGDWGGENI